MQATSPSISEPCAPTPVDVLIIGAGINGAGLFRDLCEQGITAMLVDKGDYGSGTSAAPSRLIHGGIKYLETAELRLVAQSALERNLLLKNAPHQVHPLKTTIPIFSWFKGTTAALRTLFGSTSAPRSRGAVLVKIGLRLYDYFGAQNRVMPRHRMLSKKRALSILPNLTNRIVAAGVYYDAKVNYPERLVLELVQDGLGANPKARALNYTRVLGQTSGIVELQGDSGQRYRVQPKIVVNAAGPWIDKVNQSLGVQSTLIGGTKGSHVIIDHPELAQQLKDQMIYFEADDGRICLIFEYLGRLILGSSDIPHDDPDQVGCTEAELQYFLNSVRALLPGTQITQEQIVYAYSGIRPLPRSQAREPGLISRDHSAPRIDATPERPFSILSLVGGKWTTFRGFAEEVADTLLEELKHPRKCSTRQLSIGGGAGYPEPHERHDWIRALADNTGLTEVRIQQLLERYGTRAAAIAQQESTTNRKEKLESGTAYSPAELDWIARHEQVVHLDDLLIRRTALAVRGDLDIAGIEEISAIVAAALGWPESVRLDEVKKSIELLRTKHQVKL
ncbi:glycerol-3-phosphate dehydrogenase/oxidase [Zobellella sp. An-6]|uniref:glycerol-3-phosphate dehydrogenase/oxidase n=1 Tax=Zobellella sp. An-6 TaxID=3400218 RepID=UPI00404111FC